jgi:hypothetical protein
MRTPLAVLAMMVGVAVYAAPPAAADEKADQQTTTVLAERRTNNDESSTAGHSGAELAAVCSEAGLQAICQELGRGLAPHQVFVCHQDVNGALAALRSKRLHAEDV